MAWMEVWKTVCAGSRYWREAGPTVAWPRDIVFLGPGLVSGVYHGFTTWLMLRRNGPKENTRLELVGGLEHEFYDFPYELGIIWNNHLNWPPTREHICWPPNRQSFRLQKPSPSQWMGRNSFWKNILLYHLVICYIAIENGPVEIVDLPLKKMVIFHSFL